MNIAERIQRNKSVRFGIDGAADLSHPALSDEVLNLVLANAGSGINVHCETGTPTVLGHRGTAVRSAQMLSAPRPQLASRVSQAR